MKNPDDRMWCSIFATALMVDPYLKAYWLTMEKSLMCRVSLGDFSPLSSFSTNLTLCCQYKDMVYVELVWVPFQFLRTVDHWNQLELPEGRRINCLSQAECCYSPISAEPFLSYANSCTLVG